MSMFVADKKNERKKEMRIEKANTQCKENNHIRNVENKHIRNVENKHTKQRNQTHNTMKVFWNFK